MYKKLRISWLVLLLVCAVAVSSAADRRFEKKFNVSPGGTLTVGTDVGSIHIVGSSGNEVSVVAEIRGRERDVNGFEVTADQVSGGVDVKGRTKKGNSWFWNSVDLDVRYTVTVPTEYNLHLNTSGGNIDIKTVKGSVKGETSGGDIDVHSVEGGIDLHTSGGTIRADGVKGDLQLQTSGGDIKIASVVGSVDVSTSGGNIRIGDVEGKVRAETSGGNVSLRVKGSNKGIHAETSGGNIEIEIAKNVGATIDASTSGGEVVCDLPVTVQGKISESRVRGSVNGGGSTIYAHTSGGDVRIRALE